MSLEVVILKTTHSTEIQARKVIPFVKGTDIFSIEAIAVSDRTVANLDFYYNQFLEGEDVTRSEFARRFLSRGESDRNSRDVTVYQNKVYEFLFRNRIPLLSAERKPVNVIPIDDIDTFQERTFDFVRGLIQPAGYASEDDFSYVSTFMNLIVSRDKDIGETISNLGRHYREVFSDREPPSHLVYTVQIGGAHFPEDHIPSQGDLGDIEVRVEDLLSETPSGRRMIILSNFFRTNPNGSYRDFMQYWGSCDIPKD